MIIYTGTLRARIETTKVGNVWTYKLFNDELSGSPDHINTLNIEPRAYFNVTGAPTGWTRESDGSKVVLWNSTAPEFDISPGGSLTGFAITGQAVVANPTPCTITSWRQSSNQAGAVLIGAVRTPGVIAPTVAVGGRVTQPSNGRGIPRALVTLKNGAGEERIGMTNPFGYFRLQNIPAGESYIFTVKSKSFIFPTRVVSISEERLDLNFQPAVA